MILLPKKIINFIILLSNIKEDKKVNEITKEERKNLVKVLKGINFQVKGLKAYWRSQLWPLRVSTLKLTHQQWSQN